MYSSRLLRDDRNVLERRAFVVARRPDLAALLDEHDVVVTRFVVDERVEPLERLGIVDRRVPLVLVAADHTRHFPFEFGSQSERSEEHTTELQSLMRNSYAVFCLTQK